MKESTRSQLRLFLLIAAGPIVLVFWTRAGAVKPTPPHMFRIVEESAYARLPDETRVELPPGTEFGAARFDYDFNARVTNVAGTAEIFRDGFGAED